LGLKTKIHFIVNPVAGSGRNKLSVEDLIKIFGKDQYEIVVKQTEYAKHAIALTKGSIADKADIIVACGGDGTINEIASYLVNTEVTLGIIPMGSGNGLASNLKIPRKIETALKIIKDCNTIEIDAGLINDDLFFSNTGIGFDAQVISDFEKDAKRKLWGYVTSVLKSLRNYQYHEVELNFLNQTKKISPFLLFISNSNEMGYKMSLTPKASLQDGLLDIIIVPKLSFFKMTLFALLFFVKKHYWLNEVQVENAAALTLRNNGRNSFKIQKDGESLEIIGETIEISLLPKSLKVCVP
jgi:YegS/Rv2252/BmrU family lipid kinase